MSKVIKTGKGVIVPGTWIDVRIGSKKKIFELNIS